jgi:hypothetical protein
MRKLKKLRNILVIYFIYDTVNIFISCNAILRDRKAETVQRIVEDINDIIIHIFIYFALETFAIT